MRSDAPSPDQHGNGRHGTDRTASTTRPRAVSPDVLLARSQRRPVLLLIAAPGAHGRSKLPDVAKRLRQTVGPADLAAIDPDHDEGGAGRFFLALAAARGLPPPPPYAGWTLLLLRDGRVSGLLHEALSPEALLLTLRRIGREERALQPDAQRRMRRESAARRGRRWPVRLAAASALLALAAVPALLSWLSLPPPPEPPEVFRVRAAVLVPIPPSPPPGLAPDAPLLSPEAMAALRPGQAGGGLDDFGNEEGDGAESPSLPSAQAALPIPPRPRPPGADERPEQARAPALPVVPARLASLPPSPAPTAIPETAPALPPSPAPPAGATSDKPRDPALRARPTRLVLVGDIFLGTHHPAGGAPNPLLSHGVAADAVLSPGLLRLLRGADATFGNLEMALTDAAAPELKPCSGDACFVFVGPTDYARLLADAGFDFLALANNHANDARMGGRRDSQRALAAQSIATAGLDAHSSGVRGADTAIGVLADGRRIGFAAFAPNAGTVSLFDLDGMRARVAMLKARTEFVVVSMHGGAEGAGQSRVPDGPEVYRGEDRGDLRRFARAAIDAGADVVFGHGPHVTRAVERYRGRLIAYSLGNFWAARGMSRRGLTGIAPALEVTLAGDAPPKLTVWSIVQGPRDLPELDPTEAALDLLRSLTAADFPDAVAMLDGPPVAAGGLAALNGVRTPPPAAAPGAASVQQR